jgi:hypothetical protein
MHSIVRDEPLSRQEAQPELCAYCLQPTRIAGICTDCKARISLAGSARSKQVVVLPIADLWDAPTELQVLALMQDDGAIASWIRPSYIAYAEQLDRTPTTISRTIHKMVRMGWLEARGSAPHDYRLLIPSLR